MPQIVGDRAGHAADGGQSLGVQKVLLAFLQALSHSVECRREFGDFVAAADVQRKCEVPFLQGAHTGNEIGERSRESIGDEKNQPTPGEHRDQSDAQQQAVQFLQEQRRGVIGFQNGQGHGPAYRGSQFQRGRKKNLAAQLNLLGVQ